MCVERLTIAEMERKYPNEWLFIIEPKTRENTTHLVSGIVQGHSKSRNDVYEASRKFKGDAAIRWTGDDTSQEQRPKMPLYRPRNLN
ncbi:MAG: hypothetical protein OXU23_16450 [Candidatus Poribacteria bacterium]|nr:hypothetical protein [Candidatus Poribacteria bacterium]